VNWLLPPSSAASAMGQGQGILGQCCKDPPSQCHELLDGPMDKLVPSQSVLPPSRKVASKRDSNRLCRRDSQDTTRESTAEGHFLDEAEVHEINSHASSQQHTSSGCPCGLPCDVGLCLPKKCDVSPNSSEAPKTPETEKMQLIAGGSGQIPLPVLMPAPNVVSPPPRPIARPMRSRSPVRGGRAVHPEKGWGTGQQTVAKPYGLEKRPLMPSAVRVYTPWIVVHEPRKVRAPRTSWFEQDTGASMASRWTEGVVDSSTPAASSDAAPGSGVMQMRSLARDGSRGSDRCRGRPTDKTSPVLWRDPTPEELLGIEPRAPGRMTVSATTKEAPIIQAQKNCTPTNATEALESCTASLVTQVADEAAGPATPRMVGAAPGGGARALAEKGALSCGTPQHLPRLVKFDEAGLKGHVGCCASLRHFIPRCISYGRFEARFYQAAGHNERCGSLRLFISSCRPPCLSFLGRTRV